jgi:hypothetical protein
MSGALVRVARRLFRRVARLRPGALIGEVLSRLTAVRSDFLQYPIIYYFHSTDEKESLATALPYLTRLAEEVSDSGVPAEIRLRSAMLRAAIDDLAATLEAHRENPPGLRPGSPSRPP